MHPVLSDSSSADIAIILFFSAFFTIGAIDSIRAGRATLFFRRVTRGEDVRRYWIAVATTGFLAVGLLATLLSPARQIENILLPSFLAVFLFYDAVNGL